ncbi:MAG TPA: DNA-binding protein [Anaerolineales bacterium]|nr:DNA-binding protein [Anaerolineales bacterium]
MDGIELLSSRQLANKSGWPERRIRNLIKAKLLRHIWIGGSIFLPEDALPEFIKNNMVEPYPISKQQL